MELPLFPLDTVLFPGMPLRLHVFEPRYKQMLQYCLENKSPFGVVLIKQGQEAFGPLPQPHSIGTTAHITQVERLPYGRSLLKAVGGERFRVTNLRQDLPYLVAEAESSPLPCKDEATLQKASRRLRPGVEKYLDLLQKAGKGDFDRAILPSDPLLLGFLAASILSLPVDEKQELLSSDDANELLAAVHSLFQKEVALVNALLASGMHEDKGRFPLN